MNQNVRRINRYMFKLDHFLFGLIFLSVGGVFIFWGQEIQLQCRRMNQAQNQCQVVAYRLIGSTTVQEFSNIEGAFLKQRIYEPLPGKRSIVDSRIELVIEG
jgi:hypothetical protein